MWARIVECMLGCWLLMSPFIFSHADNAYHLWINDFAVGAILIVFSLASYWKPLAWAHWTLFPVGTWLFVFGRFWQSSPLPPGLQNDIIVGLLLMMFAIIPNRASRPPKSWRLIRPEGASSQPK